MNKKIRCAAITTSCQCAAICGVVKQESDGVYLRVDECEGCVLHPDGLFVVGEVYRFPADLLCLRYYLSDAVALYLSKSVTDPLKLGTQKVDLVNGVPA